MQSQKIYTEASSNVLCIEQIAAFVILRVYEFLLKKSTLSRLLKQNVVSIVVKCHDIYFTPI